jgi:peptidoglycan/LPS O-acetylase OafA/YrhL
VLLDHGVVETSVYNHPTLLHLTRSGPNGVSLFFAISGFLICSRLLEEQEQTGTTSLWGFYVRRACRILPPALTYLGVIGILGLLGVLVVTPLELGSCIFFFRNYLPLGSITRGWGGYTIHFWSLAVEEHFYLLWPALLVLSGKSRARYLAGTLALLVGVWRWWDFRHQWVDRHISGLLFPSRTDVRLDGLFLGCLAALIVVNPGWRAWATRHLTLPVWALCAAAYALFQVIPGRHIYSIWESALLAALVTGTVLRPGTRIGKLLETPGFKLVGRLSYSLYLWQQLFLVPGAVYPLALVQRLPWNFVMVFGIAYVSYEFVERPMIRVGHRLAPPPSPGRTDLGRIA